MGFHPLPPTPFSRSDTRLGQGSASATIGPPSRWGLGMPPVTVTAVWRRPVEGLEEGFRITPSSQAPSSSGHTSK